AEGRLRADLRVAIQLLEGVGREGLGGPIGQPVPRASGSRPSVRGAGEVAAGRVAGSAAVPGSRVLSAREVSGAVPSTGEVAGAVFSAREVAGTVPRAGDVSCAVSGPRLVLAAPVLRAGQVAVRALRWVDGLPAAVVPFLPAVV